MLHVPEPIGFKLHLLRTMLTWQRSVVSCPQIAYSSDLHSWGIMEGMLNAGSLRTKSTDVETKQISLNWNADLSWLILGIQSGQWQKFQATSFATRLCPTGKLLCAKAKTHPNYAVFNILRFSPLGALLEVPAHPTSFMVSNFEIQPPKSWHGNDKGALVHCFDLFVDLPVEGRSLCPILNWPFALEYPWFFR